jgi:hypothetical protein
MNIKLPVSFGEAIDKLTILDIKCDKIKDNRKNDVQKEYDILYKELKDFTQEYDSLYKSMKKINLLIWEQMDVLRDGNTSNKDYMKLCRECIDTNDIRFRIKNKINLISKSSIKEQKSYKINTLLLTINCNNNIIPLLLKPIKYLSFMHDKIIINSQHNIDLIKNEFYYDNTINYNLNIDKLDILKKITFNKEYYNKQDIYQIIDITDDDLNRF